MGHQVRASEIGHVVRTQNLGWFGGNKYWYFKKMNNSSLRIVLNEIFIIHNHKMQTLRYSRKTHSTF